MLEYRGDDAARLLLENSGGRRLQDQLSGKRPCRRVREVCGIDSDAAHLRQHGVVGGVCALAVNNRVALDASFVAWRWRCKVVEGLVVDLQPGLSLRRDRGAHVSERKLHARVAGRSGAHERLHERAADGAAERGRVGRDVFFRSCLVIGICPCNSLASGSCADEHRPGARRDGGDRSEHEVHFRTNLGDVELVLAAMKVLASTVARKAGDGRRRRRFASVLRSRHACDDRRVSGSESASMA